jgi:hypothetical protein
METKTLAGKRLEQMQTDNNGEINEIMCILASLVCDLIYYDTKMDNDIKHAYLTDLACLRETLNDLKSHDTD